MHGLLLNLAHTWVADTITNTPDCTNLVLVSEVPCAARPRPRHAHEDTVETLPRARTGADLGEVRGGGARCGGRRGGVRAARGPPRGGAATPAVPYL